MAFSVIKIHMNCMVTLSLFWGSKKGLWALLCSQFARGTEGDQRNHRGSVSQKTKTHCLGRRNFRYVKQFYIYTFDAEEHKPQVNGKN